MKLHVLIDNLPNPANPALQHEHGLSILLQTDEGKNYLIDTGASGKFLENLEILRQTDSSLPSAEEIDAVIISHGHNDHTGGLRKFFEANETAPVYLHSEIKGNWFFSCRPKNNVREARSIGMEQSLFAEYSHRFIQVSESLSITENLTIIAMGGHPVEYPMPLGNKYLYKNDFPDDFFHETAVLIEFAPQQYAIISPCSHCGILNILDRCIQKLPIGTSSQGAKYFIGGLHYVDYLGEEDAKKEAAQIVQAAGYIKEKYPYLKVVSGHCTCTRTGDIIRSVLYGRYATFCSGYSILL